MIEKILKKYGLSEKEAKIYLTLLEMGKSAVSDIAKKAGINRSTTYVIIEALIEQGLVNTSEENKVKRYTATPPSNLIRTIEETIEKQNELLNEVNTVLPELETLFKEKQNDLIGKPTINFFEGKESIKAIYESLRETKKSVRIYATNEDKANMLPKYFQSFYKDFLNKKNNVRAILSQEKELDFFKGHVDKHAILIPRSKKLSQSEIIIFGNKVIALSFKSMFGVLIENNAIAEAYKSIFDSAWRHGKSNIQFPQNDEKLFKTAEFIKTYGIENAYIYDESKNKFGTVQDRRNTLIIREAKRLLVDKLVIVTNGERGYSLAEAARGTDIKVVCIVDKNISNDLKNSLRNIAYDVIEKNLKERSLRTEEVITIAREKDDEIIWDVTTGFEKGFESILDELKREVEPDYIVVPIASGALFTSLVQSVERENSQIKVIGIEVKDKKVLSSEIDSYQQSPYIRVMDDMQKRGHKVLMINGKEMKDVYNKYKHLAETEPFSSIVYASLGKNIFKKRDTVVFINSGKTKNSSIISFIESF